MFLLLAYAAFGLACLIGLVIWFIRRQHEMKQETFDQRDN